MRPLYALLAVSAAACACSLAACSGDDTGTGTNPTSPDAGDSSVGKDVTNPDVVTPPVDAGPDVACPTSWTDIPDADISLWPDGGTMPVLLHAGATGTQDYTCQQTTTDGGPNVYAWVFVGPEADLSDCHKTNIGKHFATDAGATRPEWITTNDNSYVVGKKLVGFTPDGGSGSIPWLLLASAANGGSGDLSKAQHIQRLFTSGGNAPATGCDANSVGMSQKVPYTADYYFYQQ